MAHLYGDVWATAYYYRSEYPESTEVAYAAVLSVNRLPEGEYDPKDIHNQMDHSQLHESIILQDEEDQISVSLSGLTGAQNEVLKDLILRMDALEARNAQLEQQVAALSTSCVP